MFSCASRKWGSVLAAGLLALAAAAVHAAPEDDYRKAVAAYQRGDVVAAMGALRGPAAAGHAPSQTMLAFILDRADYPEEAARLYREAAAQNDAEAIASLANLLQAGRGLAKDEKQALAHFSKAADLGHRQSIEVVAEAHLRGSMGAAAVDAAQSAGALRRAADIGHLGSVEALAAAYRTGRYGIAADPQQAASWEARLAALRRERGIPPPKAKR